MTVAEPSAATFDNEGCTHHAAERGAAANSGMLTPAAEQKLPLCQLDMVESKAKNSSKTSGSKNDAVAAFAALFA
ncbi:hypothetical protein [Teichococcus wenyumeiae]|uniref:hypothetical protein n=1 Tax=Teichococcus wenyumeiae TaxID=2478470 RepID=UPI0011C429FC|nr:hypothetical protein [Pseudoroseomonas wenyumeiae]